MILSRRGLLKGLLASAATVVMRAYAPASLLAPTPIKVAVTTLSAENAGLIGSGELINIIYGTDVVPKGLYVVTRTKDNMFVPMPYSDEALALAMEREREHG